MKIETTKTHFLEMDTKELKTLQEGIGTAIGVLQERVVVGDHYIALRKINDCIVKELWPDGDRNK